jgi:hypothetical protein
MSEESVLTLEFEVPKDVSAKGLEQKIQKILGESGKELKQLLAKHNVPTDQAPALGGEQVKVSYEGAGIDPATIAILIALTPLVKDLVPVVKPVVKDASEVAKSVALDLWEIVRTKLWEDHHIRVKPKKDKEKGRKK